MCLFLDLEEKGIVSIGRIDLAIGRIYPCQFAGLYNFLRLGGRIEPIRFKGQNKDFGFIPLKTS